MNNSIKNLGNEINFENFFVQSKGFWKPCKRPKRKPSYVSMVKDFFFTDNPEKYNHLRITKQDIAYNRPESYYIQFETSEVSSMYWYGEDSRGSFVIRYSNHWGRVASCRWNRSTDFINPDSFAWRACKTYLKSKKQKQK